MKNDKPTYRLLTSLVSAFLIVLGLMFSPFALAYLSFWFHIYETVQLVAILTAYMYTVLYWGMVWHAKQVMWLFALLEGKDPDRWLIPRLIETLRDYFTVLGPPPPPGFA